MYHFSLKKLIFITSQKTDQKYYKNYKTCFLTIFVMYAIHNTKLAKKFGKSFQKAQITLQIFINI